MSPTMQPQTTPTSTDACSNIVHSLLFYMQGGESESFTKKAIESLVKKLKEKRDELDSLITAVTSNGARPTKCVTIPRTLDGRLQVAGKKGFPHVIYAKIWRWPDLHKNELKQIKDCQFAFDLKQDNVCVNPYHYDRVVCPGIDLSGLSIDSTVNIDDFSSCKVERSLNETSHYGNEAIHHQQGMMPSLENGGVIPGNLYHPHVHPQHLHHHFQHPQFNSHLPHPLHHQHLPPTQHHQSMGSTMPPGHLPAPPSTISYHNHHIPPPTPGSNHNNNSSSSNGCSNSHNMNSQPQTSVRDPALVGHQSTIAGQFEQPSPMEHSSSYPHNPLCSVGGAGWNNGSSSSTNGNTQNVADINRTGYPDCNSVAGKTYNYPLRLADVNQSSISSLPPPEFWCTITYFELDQQVGETFKVPSSRTTVTVDGYTDTFDPSRICLGMLSNVHRTEISEKTRLYIGKGIELTLLGEGDVYITCRSQYPVFIKGSYLDMQAGRAQSQVVHKVHASASTRVFDLKWCYQEIKQQTAKSLATAAAQAAAVAGNIQGAPGMGALTPAISLSSTVGVSVDELRKLCVLQLSFIKGWGPDYPRPTIKDTPCWVEIQLHRPLQLLDELLQSMPLIGHNDQRRRPGMGHLLP